MADRLDDYRRKRRAAATPEPAGERARDGGDGANRFVIQEHSARRLHWDLRLERDGVLVSWALPRGIPLDPERNHKAVHTEDHPLEYLDFSGEIAAGNYGAGTMSIWDRGSYECHEFEPKKVVVTLHGERVDARFALFQAGREESDWLIHRMDPAPAGFEPMPEQLEPMRARPARLPRSAGWAYEIEWDGTRVLAICTPGSLRLQHAELGDVTGRFGELRALNRRLGSSSAILDGVLVGFDGGGRPESATVTRRLAGPATRRARSGDGRISLQIFDLLYLGDRSLLDSPYEERRARLEELELAGEAWQTPGYHRGDGAALRERSAEFGLKGIVAKRLVSSYQPGVISDDWRAIANR